MAMPVTQTKVRVNSFLGIKLPSKAWESKGDLPNGQVASIPCRNLPQIKLSLLVKSTANCRLASVGKRQGPPESASTDWATQVEPPTALEDSPTHMVANL